MKERFNFNRLIFGFIVFAIFLFILLPIIVTFLVSFNQLGFRIPPFKFTLDWYKKVLTYKNFISSAYNSLFVASLSSSIATILGVLSSFALTKYSFKGKDFINTFVMSPLMIPMSITGLSLLYFFARLNLPGGFYALTIGHTTLLIPFAIRPILASFQNFNKSLEQAALIVGAKPLKVFTSITLPIVKNGIIAGLIMSFIMSWNNFSISLFLIGPAWRTLPIEIYSSVIFELDPSSTVIASILMFISYFGIFILDRIIGIGIAVGGKRV